MRRALLLIPALGLALAPAVSAQADDGGRPYEVALTGAQEVPGPGDPDGSGTAALTVNPGLSRVCYTLTVTGIEPATGSHIHRAPAGVAGPVVVPLVPPSTGSSSGCAAVSRELALDLVLDPQGYYVNVHNATYPAGALRGQLD